MEVGGSHKSTKRPPKWRRNCSDKYLLLWFTSISLNPLGSQSAQLDQQYVSINGYDSIKRPILFGVTKGSTLGLLLSLLYINDLRYCLKYTTASHFADATCFTYASYNLKTIESNFNFDLKNLNEWLRASRLSLNIKKTNLLIFHSKFNRNNFDISIKIQGVKLNLTDQVKYPGLLIDLSCELSIRLSKANGILSKLQHFVPPSTLISVYYAIFYSHLNYSILVWSLTKSNLDKIDKLQKKCIRIINFLDFKDHTINFFHKNKIIKFYDIIQYNQIQLAYLYNKSNLSTQIMKLFHFTSEIPSHNTHAHCHKSLFIPSIKSSTYGKQSLRYMIPYEYNKFLRDHPIISDIHTMYAIKKKFNSIYMMNYISQLNISIIIIIIYLFIYFILFFLLLLYFFFLVFSFPSVLPFVVTLILVKSKAKETTVNDRLSPQSRKLYFTFLMLVHP